MVTRRAGSFAAVAAVAVLAASATTRPASATTEPPPGTAAPAGTGAAEAPTGEPILIGTLTSLTGPFTPWGLQVRDGMQLAVDEINAAGGVDGRPLELSVVDDQNNAEEGVSGAERLIE